MEGLFLLDDPKSRLINYPENRTRKDIIVKVKNNLKTSRNNREYGDN